MKKWWILLSIVPLFAYATPYQKVALQEEVEEPFKGNQWISSIENDLFNDKELEFEEEASAYVAEQVDEDDSLFPWANEENLKDELSSSFYYEEEFDTFADEEQSREEPARAPQRSERSRPQPSYEKVPQRSQSAQLNRSAPKKQQSPRAEMSEAPTRSPKQRDQYENQRQRPSVSASGRQRENSQGQERGQGRSQRGQSAQRSQQRSAQQYREGRGAPKRDGRAVSRAPKKQGERTAQGPSKNRKSASSRSTASKRSAPHSGAQSERSVRVRPLQRQGDVKNKTAHPGRHPTAENEQGQAPKDTAK